MCACLSRTVCSFFIAGHVHHGGADTPQFTQGQEGQEGHDGSCLLNAHNGSLPPTDASPLQSDALVADTPRPPQWQPTTYSAARCDPQLHVLPSSSNTARDPASSRPLPLSSGKCLSVSARRPTTTGCRIQPNALLGNGPMETH